jgi:predicted transcriptional regulator
MGSFRDKFSLSYLNPSRSQASSSDAPLGMEEALLTWGKQIVETLNTAPNQSLRALDILDKLNVRADTLFPVINHLASNGYLARLQEDPKGNDLYKLTDRGKKLLA